MVCLERKITDVGSGSTAHETVFVVDFAANDVSTLYHLDVASGRATQIGRLTTDVTDMASDGPTLYGVRKTEDESSSQLFVVDLRGRRATMIGDLGQVVDALVAHEGRLFGIGGAVMVEINASDGTTSSLATMGLNADDEAGDMHVLAVVKGQADKDFLAKINLSTGATKLIGETGVPRIYCIDYYGNGMIGVTGDGAVVQVRPDTGQATLIAETTPPRPWSGVCVCRDAGVAAVVAEMLANRAATAGMDRQVDEFVFADRPPESGNRAAAQQTVAATQQPAAEPSPPPSLEHQDATGNTRSLPQAPEKPAGPSGPKHAEREETVRKPVAERKPAAEAKASREPLEEAGQAKSPTGVPPETRQQAPETIDQRKEPTHRNDAATGDQRSRPNNAGQRLRDVLLHYSTTHAVLLAFLFGLAVASAIAYVIPEKPTTDLTAIGATENTLKELAVALDELTAQLDKQQKTAPADLNKITNSLTSLQDSIDAMTAAQRVAAQVDRETVQAAEEIIKANKQAIKDVQAKKPEEPSAVSQVVPDAKPTEDEPAEEKPAAAEATDGLKALQQALARFQAASQTHAVPAPGEPECREFKPADCPKVPPCSPLDACLTLRLPPLEYSRPTLTRQGAYAFASLFSAAAERGVENAVVRTMNAIRVCPICNGTHDPREPCKAVHEEDEITPPRPLKDSEDG